MKNLIKKLWDKALNFLKWLWAECKDWRTIVLFILVALVIGAPVWVLALLGLIFKWTWAIATAGIVWAFWMLPGAPFFALTLSITLALKKVFEKNKKISDKLDEMDAAVQHTKEDMAEIIAEKKEHHMEKKAERQEKRAEKKAKKAEKSSK